MEEQTPQSVEPKAKCCKKMKPLIGGIVVAAIVAIGGMYMYTLSEAKQLHDSNFVVKAAKVFSIDVATINGESIGYDEYLKNIEILTHVYNAQAQGGAALPEETISDLAISQSFVEKLTDDMLDEYDLEITDADLNTYKEELVAGLGGQEGAEAESLVRFNLSYDDYIKFVLTPYAKEEKVKAAYAERVDPVAEEDLLAQAAEIREQIASEEKTFEEIAGEVNVDATKAKGGDLGWFGKGTMVAQFEEAAFSQDIGVISEPVITEFGLHLIKVTEKRTTSTPDGSAEEVKASHIHLSPYADAVPYEEYRRNMLSESVIELELPIHDPFDGILKQ